MKRHDSLEKIIMLGKVNELLAKLLMTGPFGVGHSECCCKSEMITKATITMC